MKIKHPRILFICTLPPPIHGSAVVSQQIKDSRLINDSFDCDWVNLGTSRRMDEIGTRTLAKPFRFIKAWLRTLWLLITHRYALCYLAITCHGVGFLKDAPFMLLARLFCKRQVIHQHNKGMAKDVDRWPFRWLFPLCYKNVKVILLSWHLYPDIEKVVKKEDVFICPNGIKVVGSKVQGSHQLLRKDSETNRVPRLLFLSNLIESKGVFVLLDALKILKDEGYSFICNFVGGETKEIDTKRFNEAVERRGLCGMAVYVGRKYGEDKETELENTDVFVFPTYYENETFGLVNLEAMAHRKPIVATNEGGIPDVVKNGVNGLICEREDPSSLARCIEKLICDPLLRHQMGEMGYRILHEKFTDMVFEERIKEILTTCCDNNV